MELLPRNEYYASLPRHLCSAALLVRDEHDRVLLLQTTYRTDSWEIPGGALDPAESPWETARREGSEELGLPLVPGRLLVVDWLPAVAGRRPALANYVFDGGRLGPDQLAAVRLDDGELSAWRMCAADQQEQLLSPGMFRRVSACAEAAAAGRTTYLEGGCAPGEPPAVGGPEVGR